VLNLVECLKDLSSFENTSIDRIKLRIVQTSIPELRQRLIQHLEETNLQKKRLEEIIEKFGEGFVDAKYDIPSSGLLPIKIITKEKILTKDKDSRQKIDFQVNEDDEEEMALVKQDLILEHQELIAYDALIKMLQSTELSHKDDKVISLLEKSLREEESMIKWYKLNITVIFDKLWPKVINPSILRGQTFLRDYVGSKISLVIIYVDLVGSTNMSMTLPVDTLVTIIRSFTRQMSHVVDNHHGYVLKYVGDAVISFLPYISSTYNDDPLINAVECGKDMINVIKNDINTIFKKYDYPELSIKIGIDLGENAIVQYGYEEGSPIDILGYSMNVASKITSLTSANKISIGENVYKSLNPVAQREFHEVLTNVDRWKYVNYGTDKTYKVYTTNQKIM